MFKYLPYEERAIDTQYGTNLKMIFREGSVAESAHDEGSSSFLGPSPMRFDLRNGFPIITERDMASSKISIPQWQQAIGEIFAFLNGVRTTDDLEKFGCIWWKDWKDQEKANKRRLEIGDMGPGSYGPAFHDFPRPAGLPSFNQMEAIVRQIKERPNLRTHFISPWIPFYTVRIKGITQKVLVCPCHGWMHFRVINNKLNLVMFQRSGDFPIGIPANMIQYSALLMAMCHITNYEPGLYIHMISDAHIYDNQREKVEELLKRLPRRFPTVTLKDPPDSIFDFRRENFVLGNDYYPHPGMKIPLAV